MVADPTTDPFRLAAVLNSGPLLRAIVADRRSGCDVPSIALAFQRLHRRPKAAPEGTTNSGS
jgi:hypothetical protein